MKKQLTAQEELLWPPTLMTESPHAGRPTRGAEEYEQWFLQAKSHRQLFVRLISELPSVL